MTISDISLILSKLQNVIIRVCNLINSYTSGTGFSSISQFIVKAPIVFLIVRMAFWSIHPILKKVT